MSDTDGCGQLLAVTDSVREMTGNSLQRSAKQATAEEVAEQLGVSQSTFLYHLRGAEEKVFEQTFEDLAEVDNHE